MPVYTYRCENCGIRFEETQKFVDPPLTRCPECGKKTLRKVYQPVGIVFKGSGFYATDHRSPSGGGKFASHPEDHPSSNSESSGESKPSENKPATEPNSASSKTTSSTSSEKSA